MGDVSDPSALHPGAETLIQEDRARIPGVRGRPLRPLVRCLEMRFPTFPPAVRRAITEWGDVRGSASIRRED